MGLRSLVRFVWGLSIRWYLYWECAGYLCKRLYICFICWGVYREVYCVLLCIMVFILIYIFGVLIMALVVKRLSSVGVVLCYIR